MHAYEVRPRKDKRGVDLISDALPFGRLWYGEPGAVGNAVDCFPRVINVPIEGLRAQVGFAEGMLDSSSNKFGILCYSGTVNDPVLWSHYSNGHRGIALGFEVPPSDVLVKVTYADERPVIDFNSIHASTASEAVQFAKSLMARPYSVKARTWSYEQEYRQFFLLESCSQAGGLCYTEIPLLKRIVLGARCNMDTSYFDHFLNRSSYEGVTVVKASRSATSYKIEA